MSSRVFKNYITYELFVYLYLYMYMCVCVCVCYVPFSCPVDILDILAFLLVPDTSSEKYVNEYKFISRLIFPRAS